MHNYAVFKSICHGKVMNTFHSKACKHNRVFNWGSSKKTSWWYVGRSCFSKIDELDVIHEHAPLQAATSPDLILIWHEAGIHQLCKVACGDTKIQSGEIPMLE